MRSYRRPPFVYDPLSRKKKLHTIGICKNRTTGTVASLGPCQMLELKFDRVLTGGSGEEDF